jgi:hypothetical protein
VKVTVVCHTSVPYGPLVFTGSVAVAATAWLSGSVTSRVTPVTVAEAVAPVQV